jgi:tRNA threonylcarbamoyladenosine dehydratase
MDKAHRELFSRTELLIGREGIERLRKSFVVVAGLGAVGSYAVEALARAGVGRLRLVDFDEVRPANRNRQLYALESTTGKPKVEVAGARVLDIHPSCRVETLRAFVHADTLEEVLAGAPSLAIDAIDSLAPKVELIAGAVARGVPILSGMGAATRTDPSQVRAGDLFKARNCPLARLLRKKLRKRGIVQGVRCVYSMETIKKDAGCERREARHETPDARRETREAEPGMRGVGKEAALDSRVSDRAAEETDAPARGRKRPTLGSLPTLTGMFGLWLAHEAIAILLGWNAMGRGLLRKRSGRAGA